MHRTNLLVAPVRLLFALLAVLSLGGCAQQGTALDRSLAAYDGGRFEESLTLAEEAGKESSTTKESLEASYLAGMSAYRLGRHADAVRWLQDPSRADDRWMAGQANVTLGSAYLQTGRKGEAAKAFAKAGGLLEGEDAKKARIAAGNAYRELGDVKASNEQFRLANVPVPSTTAPPAASPGSGPPTTTPPTSSPTKGGTAVASADGPFVLQAGAFKDHDKAMRRADEVRAKAKQNGCGEPKVLSKRGTDGATVYVVQFGSFADRRSAESALGKLGLSGVVVGRPVA